MSLAVNAAETSIEGPECPPLAPINKNAVATSSGFPRLAKIVPSSASADTFVPNGWNLEKKIEGDLNGDGIPDLVLLLRKNDPKNIVTTEEDGCPALVDTNPRILAVAFGQKSTGKYVLVLQNQTLIPRNDLPPPDEALVHLWDPLGSISIVRGTLRVSLAHGSDRDSNISKETYTFRYLKGCFQQIGYDSREIDTKGSGSETSINYLTKKEKISSHSGSQTHVESKTLPDAPLLCIDEINQPEK